VWFESDAVDLDDPSMDGVAQQSVRSEAGEWAKRAAAAKQWSQKLAVGGSWLAQKVGDPSTGVGHKVILDIGHFFGHKFRPYEAVRWAGRIGKAGEVAAKWAPLLGVLAEAAGQYMDERAESQRLAELRAAQDEIRGEVASAGDFLIGRVREESIQKIEEAFEELRQPIVEARRELDAIEGQLHGTRAVLASARADAQSLLEEIRGSRS
jgi:hypothetical protein